MSELDPAATTVNDLCAAALKESGAVGNGQTPLAEDITAAWARLQWMLQQWARKRYLVYHLVTYMATSTGATSYTVGPGGTFDLTVRPDKIESGFLRQLTQSQPNQIDYPLGLLHSMEDYNRIALKQLKSFPGWVFYDPAWPIGNLYTWPVATASIYAIAICVKEQLPAKFAGLSSQFVLPYEYYAAMLYNLALRLRAHYAIPAFPGDPLPGLAADSLAVLRGANAAIPQLMIPGDLSRPGIYNIFSDRSY